MSALACYVRHRLDRFFNGGSRVLHTGKTQGPACMHMFSRVTSLPPSVSPEYEKAGEGVTQSTSKHSSKHSSKHASRHTSSQLHQRGIRASMWQRGSNHLSSSFFTPNPPRHFALNAVATRWNKPTSRLVAECAQERRLRRTMRCPRKRGAGPVVCVEGGKWRVSVEGGK